MAKEFLNNMSKDNESKGLQFKSEIEKNQLHIQHKIKPMPSVGTLSPKMKFYQGDGRAKQRKDYKNLITNKLKSDVKSMQKQRNMHNNNQSNKRNESPFKHSSSLGGIHHFHNENGDCP